jgi:hypothetical protein
MLQQKNNARFRGFNMRAYPTGKSSVPASGFRTEPSPNVTECVDPAEGLITKSHQFGAYGRT